MISDSFKTVYRDAGQDDRWLQASSSRNSYNLGEKQRQAIFRAKIGALSGDISTGDVMRSPREKSPTELAMRDIVEPWAMVMLVLITLVFTVITQQRSGYGPSIAFALRALLRICQFHAASPRNS